ncbi:hypothetical protein ACIPPS_03710 [Streptomyces sp. NPDC090127]|uniref:hypothetical protein n=1 Tax=Streptomyces sp. NPDC090127 TaxID=3365953 RepID=UPI0038295327
MISEPELDGGDGFPAPQLLAPQLLAPEPREPKPPRPRGPWLWAVGGAAVASAVWAGGLVAYERSQSHGPDLGGYRTVEHLCEKAELKALSGMLGKQSVDRGSPTDRHPALDRARCSVTLGSADTGYGATVLYDLHKVTDPEPEFEARLGDLESEAKPYPGLGERAFFQREDGDAGAWMRVLDGQAELEIWISVQQSWDVEKAEATPITEKVDLSGIEAALAQDLADLMAALKT